MSFLACFSSSIIIQEKCQKTGEVERTETAKQDKLCLLVLLCLEQGPELEEAGVRSVPDGGPEPQTRPGWAVSHAAHVPLGGCQRSGARLCFLHSDPTMPLLFTLVELAMLLARLGKALRASHSFHFASPELMKADTAVLLDSY